MRAPTPDFPRSNSPPATIQSTQAGLVEDSASAALFYKQSTKDVLGAFFLRPLAFSLPSCSACSRQLLGITLTRKSRDWRGDESFLFSSCVSVSAVTAARLCGRQEFLAEFARGMYRGRTPCSGSKRARLFSPTTASQSAAPQRMGWGVSEQRVRRKREGAGDYLAWPEMRAFTSLCGRRKNEGLAGGKHALTGAGLFLETRRSRHDGKTRKNERL